MSCSDRLLFPVTSALAVALSVACGITDAAAQTPQKVSMRLDWVISGYHAPYFVGIKNGYYKDEGLDVTIEPGNGSANVAQAIGNGNGEFATVDGGAMMQLVAKGLPVKSVMGLYQRNPIGVIYNIKSGITKPKDVEGKTLVITNGDAPAALLPAFMAATGVDIKKVNIVSTDPASKNAAVISGRGDAVVTFSFQAIPIIEAAGVSVKTFDYADYGVTVPGITLIARPDYLDKNPETVKKMARAIRKSFEWTIANPEKAVDILGEMNPGQKILMGTALPVLKGSFALLHSSKTAGQPIGVMAREDWVTAEEVLVKYVGMLKVDSPDRYFTNAFVSAP
jgi:NitT/TauT family transport system substrate-binding protein